MKPMPITLEVPDGGLVGYAELPPFNVPPDVILWGERVFRLHQDMREYGPEGEPKGRVHYREAFFYALPVNYVKSHR